MKRSVSISPLRGIVLTTVVLAGVIGLGLLTDFIQASLLPLNEKLVKAVENGDRQQVRSLLEHGADANYIYAPRPLLSQPQRSPVLMLAQDVGTAQVLMDHGARVNATNNRGETALYYALRFHHAELAHLLRQYGARE